MCVRGRKREGKEKEGGKFPFFDRKKERMRERRKR